MDRDEVLIEEVRSRPILYDVEQSDYKNLKQKEYAWREIAANLRMDKKECKKRWKGLRDSYKRCKKMRQAASGSESEPPKRMWRYLKAMSFLENIKCSKNFVPFSPVENIVKEELEQECSDIKVESIDEFVSPASQCSISSQEKMRNYGEEFQQFLDLAANSIKESCSSFSSQDSTATHFASLAAKIKEANMPPKIVNQIEAKVSALVFAEIETFYSKN